MKRTPHGCFALALFIALVVLFPFLLANVMLAALEKLGLSPQASVIAALAIFFGSTLNIPVRRLAKDQEVESNWFPMFGFDRMFPHRLRRRSYTLIAVNVGGCLVPCGLAVYELWRLSAVGSTPFAYALAAVAVNIGVCYWLARPVPNVGIAMPPLVPALVAALCALLAAREMAPMIAFAAGVLGPVIGADLLHIREVKNTTAGVASIGGAGTFDGIVLSGLVATLLA